MAGAVVEKVTWAEEHRAQKVQRTELDKEKQGRIHGNPVADDWAGAVMRKPIVIQKCDGRTDRHGKV